MATRSVRAPRVRGLQKGDAQSQVLWNAVERHGGQDGEARNAASGSCHVAIE